MEVYDNLEISFNDAEGVFKSEDGKGINFGEKIEWKLQPLLDEKSS